MDAGLEDGCACVSSESGIIVAEFKRMASSCRGDAHAKQIIRVSRIGRPHGSEMDRFFLAMIGAGSSILPRLTKSPRRFTDGAC